MAQRDQGIAVPRPTSDRRYRARQAGSAFTGSLVVLRAMAVWVGMLVGAFAEPPLIPNARSHDPTGVLWDEPNDDTESIADFGQLARRLDRLEVDNAKLWLENRQLNDELTKLKEGGADPPKDEPAFRVGEYDRSEGAFILTRPRNPADHPFELRFDLFTQARYSNFAREDEFWTDSTGAPQPIPTIDSIEVTRQFFRFAGYAIDPKLQYTAFVFASTALNDVTYLGWINYRFSKAFDLRVGNWAIPGTREWYESFRFTQGADRLMATTFFRPNISPGIWAQGEPLENVHYVAMVANSFNRFNQGVDRIGGSLAFGGTLWWEPQGPFGAGPSDIEHHLSPVSRIGAGLVASRETNQGITTDRATNPEDTILRLSDGTPLFRVNALGPGVELRSAAVQVLAFDAAVKYAGASLSGEYLLRWLNGFNFFRGSIPDGSLFDHGAILQGGYFVIPNRLEGFSRASFVTGPFGGGEEFGGGVNWFVRGTRDWRFTAEVLQVQDSPAQNILTPYRAGASGTILMLQCFVDF